MKEVMVQTSLHRQLLCQLLPFYQQVMSAWHGRVSRSTMVLGASRDVPLLVSAMTTQSAYRISLGMHYTPPHCIEKFRLVYGKLYWPSTWQQLHAVRLERAMVDFNWKVAHGVLYTASHLVNSFGYRNMDVMRFCSGDEEYMEHLLVFCPFAQIMVTGSFSCYRRHCLLLLPSRCRKFCSVFRGQGHVMFRPSLSGCWWSNTRSG